MRNLNWRIVRITVELNLMFLGAIVGGSIIINSAWWIGAAYVVSFGITSTLTYVLLDNWKGRLARYE